MSLTKEQRDRADQIVAWAMGQWSQSPESMMTESEFADADFRDRVDSQVFYCEECGYWCDTGERNCGDICDTCLTEQE